MKPSVGRIVHFVSSGTADGENHNQICLPAMVTNILEDGCVGLAIFGYATLMYNTAEQDETEKKVFTWHWPERVED